MDLLSLAPILVLGTWCTKHAIEHDLGIDGDPIPPQFSLIPGEERFITLPIKSEDEEVEVILSKRKN